MSKITFKRHRLQLSDIGPAVIWDQYPWPLLDMEETVSSAGFNPNEEFAIGILPEDWNGHLRNSIIIAPDINLLPSDEFAVSEQPLDVFWAEERSR